LPPTLPAVLPSRRLPFSENRATRELDSPAITLDETLNGGG
jgi:hypothetical protein